MNVSLRWKWRTFSCSLYYFLLFFNAYSNESPLYEAHSAHAAVTLSHIQTHKHLNAQKLPLRWFSLQWVSPRTHFATMTHTHTQIRTQKRKALPADTVSAGDNCRGVTVRVPSRFGASSYIENTSGCHIMARACVCERECDQISCVGKFGGASGGSEEDRRR